MKEESLREAMRRAASREPPAGDAYARFVARRRRGIRFRGLFVLTAGAAAVATLFLVLPGPFNQGPPANFSGGGTNTPVGNVRRFIDPKAGFQLEYPGDWLARGRSGDFAEFYPPNGKQDTTTAVLFDIEYCKECGGSAIDQPSGQKLGTQIEHPRRFYVRIVEATPISSRSETAERRDVLLQQRHGAHVEEMSDVVSGARAARFDSVFSQKPQNPTRADRKVGPDFWCAGCTTTEYFFANHGWQFDVRIVAPDAVSWNTYAAEATRLMETFSSYSPTAQPTSYP